MKVQIMLRILFRLLRTRRASAAELARETEVSERSIHRYVEELIVAGVPIDIIRGRRGGLRPSSGPRAWPPAHTQRREAKPRRRAKPREHAP